MNTDLTSLKPALVWKHFAAMTQIPRPSFHEEKIRRYVLDVARSLGLECREDAAHNVYVRKPASKGMENRAGVILQAHLDMVPQKNNDKKFDFLKDPIRAYVDGDWVTADGTTLGLTTVSVRRRFWPCWRTIRWSTVRWKRSSRPPRRRGWTARSG